MMRHKRANGIRIKRTVRKMLAAAVGAAMVFAISASPVLAEGQNDGPGSITLELDYKDSQDAVHQMMDGEVSLYTVATVTESDGYHYDLNGGVFADVDDESVQDIPNLTQDQFDEESQLHTVADILAENYLEGREFLKAEIKEGKVSFTGLYPGLYLVVNSREASDKVSFAPFLMSLPNDEEGYDLVAKPKPGVVPPESSSENPPPDEPEKPDQPDKPDQPNQPDKPNQPDQPDKPDTPNKPDKDRPRTDRTTPPDNPAMGSDPPPESGVLGAVRENGQQVLGALRHPQEVLGAVRTGDPSAIFICGEILVLASAMLMGWVYAFRRLIKH